MERKKMIPHIIAVIAIALTLVLAGCASTNSANINNASTNIGGGEGSLQFGDFDYKIVESNGVNTVIITGYRGELTDVNIPQVIEGMPVTAIGENAFCYSAYKERTHIKNQLTSVIIPEGVTSIGNYAFYTNALTSVIIPEGVTSIGNLAFSYNKLTNVIIPEGVTSIGNYAFNNNRITSFSIPSNITSIGNGWFSNNQLSNVVIPSNITSIGNEAFSSNQINSIVIPQNVTSIGENAFSKNKLTNVTLPADMNYLSYDAFGNDLEELYFTTARRQAGIYTYANGSWNVNGNILKLSGDPKYTGNGLEDMPLAFNRGVEYVYANNFAAAAILFDKSAKMKTPSSRDLIHKGYSLEETFAVDSAKKNARLQMAGSLINIAEYDHAEEILNNQLLPTERYFLLGRVYNGKKEYAEAIENLTKALEYEKNGELYFTVLYARAEAYVGNNEYDKAKADYAVLETLAIENEDKHLLSILKGAIFSGSEGQR